MRKVLAILLVLMFAAFAVVAIPIVAAAFPNPTESRMIISTAAPFATSNTNEVTYANAVDEIWLNANADVSSWRTAATIISSRNEESSYALSSIIDYKTEDEHARNVVATHTDMIQTSESGRLLTKASVAKLPIGDAAGFALS